MSKAGETFFTSVGCMDGRSEWTVAKWGREKFGVLYADAITEAGLVGLFSKKSIGKSFLNSLKKKILISIGKHQSRNVVVSGHQECAGNPVADSQHKKDILKAAKVIGKMVPQVIKIIPVFVERGSTGWTVKTL